MADTGAKEKNPSRRQELDVSIEYLQEEDAGLFLFKHIGDVISGTVLGARRENTVIDGVQKTDPKGNNKRHLSVLVKSDQDDREWVVNIQSQNQKEALRKACENAGIRGLAVGDHFEMEHTHMDAPMESSGRKELSAARGYACTVSIS